MIVKIDNRESQSRIKSAENFFKKMGYGTSVEHLNVGDYVFHDRICFEYKNASDMIGSIKDGRVFKQARNMLQYDYSYVIIEGSVPKQINQDNSKAYWNCNSNNKKKPQSSFTVKSYLGAVARLETYSDVLVVENRQQAWILMDALVSKIFKDNVDVKMVDRPQTGLTNPIASYLSCIYINDHQRLPVKSALKITDYLEDNGLKLLDLEYSDLISIEGIGKKTAQAVDIAIGELK